MEMEKQMFGKQTFTMPCRDNGTQSGPCQVFLPTISTSFVALSDDSSIPRRDSKFF